MRLVDLYYRAFDAFRKHTKEESNSQKLRKHIANANHMRDFLTAVKYDCEIDIEWIENIEEGLIYVEKAIWEERQFIRAEGEVIPIEKVKRVSKTSVEHLSRHSNLITRAPKEKDADIIPEKLFIVEKLTDYLVYENRFLYMLLCYLKDFIQMRLDKIKDKTTSFQTEMTLDKEVDESQRHLQYQLIYSDYYKNDPLLLEQYKQIPLVDRAENIFALVVSFLNTPLMKEVSKAPMIKPPVVKTNVLRMNPNFRAALKLYDFITAYNKDGYTIKEVKKTFNPFTPETGDEVAETIQLTSTLAYVVGNDISEMLHEGIEEEERINREKQRKKEKEELKRLKKRMIEMNEDSSEYILKLERRNLELEKLGIELSVEKEKNEALTDQNDALKEEKKQLDKLVQKLKKAVETKDATITTLNQKYFDDMTEAERVHQDELKAIRAAHEKRVKELNEAHAEEINNLVSKHAAEVEALLSKHAEEKEALIDAHAMEKETLINEHNKEKTALIDKHTKEQADLIEAHTKKVTALNTHVQYLNTEIETLNIDIDTMRETHKNEKETYEQIVESLEDNVAQLHDEKKFANAQYTALMKQQGLLSEDEDFTSKHRFKQLEEEMTAYKKLFKEQWKKAKAQIRERVKEETFTNGQDSDHSNQS